ncbi:GTPase-activating protein gyp8 [Microbotryomycetes sp. JL201]|nr:GTPase-activating protein gyp8 [Microbotryomycetes sp. JL201]
MATAATAATSTRRGSDVAEQQRTQSAQVNDVKQHTQSDAVPSSSTSPQSKSPARARQDDILRALTNGDLEKLRLYSQQRHGFESDELRKRVWPFLLGCNVISKGKEKATGSADEGGNATTSADSLKPHSDERQVHLDVIRSFVNYPEGLSNRDKDALRCKLEQVIVSTLRRFPALQYFQGFHDIATVLLLILDDENVAQQATERMCLHRIRDNMGSGLEPVMGYLRLVIQRHDHSCLDPQLADLVDAAAELPYFSLSWVLTLMSHDLTSLNVIARLFDFLLAHNPAMISYIGAAIILMKKETLLELDSSSAQDPATLHHALSQLPNFVAIASAPSTAILNPLSLPPLSETANAKAVGLTMAQAASSEVDEDLMSSRSRSESMTTMMSTDDDNEDDQATRRRHEHDLDMDLSVLSYSTTSNQSEISYQGDVDDDGLIIGDMATEVFEEMMLSDPDVVNLALSNDDSRPHTERRVPHRRNKDKKTTRGGSMDSIVTDNDVNQQPELAVMSIDELIERALELYERFPLLDHPFANDEPERPRTDGRQLDSIHADQIMGPNSCIFTWPLSVEGRLTNKDAHDLAKDGTNVVLQIEEQGRSDRGNSFENDSSTVKDDATVSVHKTRNKKRKARSSGHQIGLGTSLIVLGLTGVFLAFYGNEVKEFVIKTVPAASFDKRDWTSNLFKHR